MALTWDSGIQRCTRCNKLMRGGADRALCTGCAAEERAAQPDPQVASDASLAEKINRLQAELEFGRNLQNATDQIRMAGALAGEEATAEVPGTSCVLCGKPVLPGSEYCLGCHAGVHRTISEAMTDLHTRIGLAPKPAIGMGAVRDGLDEKRARTATSRINPSGAQRIKR